MRPLLLSLLLLAACSRPVEQATRPSQEDASTAANPGGEAAPPAPGSRAKRPTPPPPRPSPEAPVTQPGTGTCQADADCALTHVPEGGDCAISCTPRALPRAEAEKLERGMRAREAAGRPCPDPMCRPPSRQSLPVCEAGRCALRHVQSETL